MLILGIETSCDETAASVIRGNAPPSERILSNIILSQTAEHLPYGGVVPEIAARAHLDYLPQVIESALQTANITLDDLDAIAVTGGPGLIGGVLVGVMAAKSIAMIKQIPFLAVNHLEGHALTPRLTDDVQFPYLLLLASGGHCQFLEVLGVGNFRFLGSTIDDAAGEAIDKVAKMLGHDYPGGPIIEKLAMKGDPNRFSLPLPLKGRPGCDLSFSGLKTAVRQVIEAHSPLCEKDKADIAASFQQTIVKSLCEKARNAIHLTESKITHFVVAGGVAANQLLRHHLTEVCQQNGLTLLAPPLPLCTDNAAMIAWVGFEHFQLGHQDSLDFAPRPRWPLAERDSQQTGVQI